MKKIKVGPGYDIKLGGARPVYFNMPEGGASQPLYDTMQKGTVKFYNTTKGYGFIQPENGSEDVFVHVSAVERAGLAGLAEGQKVVFALNDKKGQQAVDLEVVTITN